jgi:hypothetical protein
VRKNLTASRATLAALLPWHEFVLDAGPRIAELDVQTEQLDVPRGETQNVADALKFADLGLAPAAVLERVH